VSGYAEKKIPLDVESMLTTKESTYIQNTLEKSGTHNIHAQNNNPKDSARDRKPNQA